MGKFQNYSSRSCYSIPNFLWIFPVTCLAKATYWDFEISNFNLKKIILKFSFTWNPMRVNFQNATPTVLILLNQTFPGSCLWRFSPKLPTGIFKFKSTIFSSAWLGQQSNCHGMGVHCPLTWATRKPLHGSSPNIMRSHLSTISLHDDFLALLCATAEQSYCRHAGVHPSVVRKTQIW